MNSTGKGFGIAGLILGIVAAVLAWFYFVNIGAIVCGILGLILSCVGMSKAKAADAPRGLATAGLVLSIIGLGLAVIGFLSCTICVACVADTANDIVKAAKI